MEIFKSLIAGGICGVIFSAASLPIPAPPVFSGVVGIIGVYVGYVLVQRIRG